MILFQSFIGNTQRSYVSESCVPLDASWNAGPDSREYELFSRIHASQQPREPWGLISWKFELKTGISANEFAAYCKTSLGSGCHCVFINPMIGSEAVYRDVWEQGEHCGHRGIHGIAEHLSTRGTGGFQASGMGRESFSLCNYFVGTPRFWDAYLAFVREVLAELVHQADGGTHVGRVFSGRGWYQRDIACSMRAFVIERLFSSFVRAHPHLSVVPFRHSEQHYVSKFGDRLGGLLFRMSATKNSAMMSRDEALLGRWNEAREALTESPYVMALWHLDDPPEFLVGDSCAMLNERWQRRGFGLDVGSRRDA